MSRIHFAQRSFAVCLRDADSATLGTWVVYCVMPEPVRKPVVMPVNSTIYRWNEIASALGHPGTQVAAQQQANSFFLSDVESVVEKVLARNMKSRRIRAIEQEI